MHWLQHHLYTEVASLDLYYCFACHVFPFTADAPQPDPSNAASLSDAASLSGQVWCGVR